MYRIALMTFVAFGLAAIAAGCFANPKAQEESAALGRELLVLKEQFTKTASSIEDLYAKQKAGELSPEDVLEALPKLVAQSGVIKAQMEIITDKISGVREKYGGSWWKTAASIALSLLVGAGGAGGLGLKWLSKSRALEGALSLVVGAIETHEETVGVKLALSNAGNLEVERVVEKRQIEWAEEGRS